MERFDSMHGLIFLDFQNGNHVKSRSGRMVGLLRHDEGLSRDRIGSKTSRLTQL